MRRSVKLALNAIRTGVVISLFILSILKESYAQHKLTIQVTTPSHFKGASITLSANYPYEAVYAYQEIKGTVPVIGNQFTMHLNASTAEFYNLEIIQKNNKRLNKLLFLEPGRAILHIKDTLLEEITIQGNQAAIDYSRFSQTTKVPAALLHLRNQRDSLLAAKDTLLLPQIKRAFTEQYRRMLQEWAAASLTWVRENPTHS